jgi:hypothetical protein
MESTGMTFGEIPSGVDVPPGQGLLEIAGAGDQEVRVDEVGRGHGAKIMVPLVAGMHEVKLGPTKKHVVEVRAGRTTRFEVSQMP